ncbi:MAG: UDP-N-acetylmuramoyl-tripeptide--D-alanyl-D-alanine ligase [Verrucomicrobia bacterium]|nr:UDP-N-acetylmuramoyl-tripeptide--D-alanyl-D-alanine ligase [Verrucomicrobiota bacterium]
MEPRTLQYIAQACAGEQLTGQADTLASRVSTDSRSVATGDLFVALRGDRFDGHNFLEEVELKGVVAVVVERSALPVPPLNLAVIAVENTRSALGRLAACYRHDFDLSVVAVAGSNGKSTTKELIAAVARQALSTLASEASFNNDIGVPLTLLRLEDRHRAAVLEVGTNHPGELAPLVAMIEPQVGVITSLGREHLEFFGDLDGVAKEEGMLAELLPASGRLFLNTSNGAAAEQIARRSRAPVVRFGWDAQNDWSAVPTQFDETGTTFLARAPRADFSGSYRVNLLGRHQVLNALLAVAVGAELGLSVEQVRAGLAECRPLKMRLQLWETNGLRVLDDCYNANADSLRAALQTLSDLPCAGRRIAVLGDMAELGAHSREAHEDAGRWAAEFGFSQLFTIGKQAHVTAQNARDAGAQEVHEFAEVGEAVRVLKATVRAGDLVLLKASRVAGLERVSEALKQFKVPPQGGNGAAPALPSESIRALPPSGGTPSLAGSRH